MRKKYNKKVTKAVIAVAGYGTRFLPATKNQPKEMLPIIDKPIIQYVVEEAVASGIKDIILITRAGESSLEDHFDSNLELENMLEKNGKKDLLREIREIPKMANFIYIRQKKHFPYGNATPMLAARNLIDKNERFAYMFGDDLVLSKTPCTKQLINYSNKKNNAVTVAVQEVPKSEVNRYGIIKLKPNSKDRMESAIEKPDPDKAPSRLAQFGRSVLNREIIDIAYDKYKNKKLGKDGELWIVDMVVEYAKRKPVYAAKISGEWLTTGDPLRYMKAQVRYALEREDIGKDFKKYLKDLKL